MKKINTVIILVSLMLASSCLSCAAKTLTPEAFIAKIAKKKYSKQMTAVEQVTDEALLAEISKTYALPADICLSAFERITDPEKIADVARNAVFTKVQKKAMEKTADQSVFIDILMEPDIMNIGPFAEAAAKLTETSAAEVATKAPIEYNRKLAISHLNDQQLLADIAVKEEGNTVSMAAVERLTDQNLLADLAITGATQSLRIGAIEKLTDQNLLEQIFLGSVELPERTAALSQISDYGVLEKILTLESLDKSLREDTVRKVKNQAVLAKIARDESDQKMLEATLTNLDDPEVLLDVARTARYVLTRRIIIARIDSQWRRDLDLVSVRFNVGRVNTDLKVTVKNHSQDVAYDRLLCKFVSMNGINLNTGLELDGRIEPGKTETLTMSLAGDWGSTITDQSSVIILKANPVLPNKAIDLTASGESADNLEDNHSPIISETAVWKHITTTDGISGDIRGVTTEVFVDATDPDGDVLTYEWSVSNGTFTANRPIATWERPVHNKTVQSGTITVRVDDGRGGHATRTFTSDMGQSN